MVPPHPSLTVPQASAGQVGVQHSPLTQTSLPHPPQSTVPPQPLSEGPQMPGVHVVMGVQQAPWKQTSAPPQLPLQSIVSPQPSSTAEPQPVTPSHVRPVHPQTPLSQGPSAQSSSSSQAPPGGHGGHRTPPQSVSVSVLLSSPSVHSAGAKQPSPAKA
jgi:hypothetical protein